MFLLVSVRHVGAHPDGHQHGVSIKSSINLDKTFLRISRIRNIPLTWILAMVFAHLPPFISQILDLIYWTVLIFILIYFEWRDTENRQYGLQGNSLGLLYALAKKNRSLLASLLNNGRVSFPKFPNPPPFHRHWQISSIRHLHISHNALFCLPKFCIIFFFHFSWVLQPFQEKLKAILMPNFGGQIRYIWEMCKWRISSPYWPYANLFRP